MNKSKCHGCNTAIEDLTYLLKRKKFTNNTPVAWVMYLENVLSALKFKVDMEKYSHER